MRRPLAWQPEGGRRFQITELMVEPAATALVLVDLQIANVDPAAGCGPSLRARFPEQARHYYTSLESGVVARAGELLRFFRERGLPVVHTWTATLRPDGSDLAAWSWRAARFGALDGVPCVLHCDDPAAAPVPSLAPRPGELSLFKTTQSPFNGTALDQYLRNMRVENLVLAGVLTNGAVETAARDSADRGYNVVLAHDACAALSEEDHRAGTEVASWHVTRTSAEVVAAFGALLDAELAASTALSR